MKEVALARDEYGMKMTYLSKTIGRGLAPWMRFVGTAAAVLVLCATAAAQTQFLQLERPPEPEVGGFLKLRTTAPPYSRVMLQVRTNLNEPRWVDYGQTAFASSNGAVLMLVPHVFDFAGTPVPSTAFFRLKVETFALTASDDGTNVCLRTTQPMPLEVLLAQFSSRIGMSVLPRAGADPNQIIDPLEICTSSVEEIIGKTGLNAWVVSSASTNGAQAGRFAPSTGFQGDPLPPTSTGSGNPTNSFAGEPGPTPTPGPDDPPPSSTADNPLAPNVQPEPDGTEPEPDPTRVEPGRHIRATATVNYVGGVQLLRASERPGDALLDFPPAAVADDSLVIVVRSSLVSTNPGSIYSIQTQFDPFSVRSHEQPLDESETLMIAPSASVRFPISLLPNDTNLASLTVSLYRSVGPVEGETLNPAIFLRHPDRFVSLGEISGAEVNRLLATGGGAQRLRAAKQNNAPAVTQLVNSGSRASKYNLVIIGDGFNSSANDQNIFNGYVASAVITNWLSTDLHPEILNAMNVFRINTISTDSGVTQVDSNGTVTVSRNTALNYRYSGIWSRCWMESGTNTDQLIQEILDDTVPEADAVAVVLNVVAGGGCSGSFKFAVTLGNPVGENFNTFAHEFGHFFGGLGDEYDCTFEDSKTDSRCRVYTNTEPSKVNLTKEVSYSKIKWKEWIPPGRPLPTPPDTNTVGVITEDVGLFVGGTSGTTKYWSGLNRPTWSGRMKNSGRTHNPIGYTAIRDKARLYQRHYLHNTLSGNFNGDAQSDLVLLDGKQLSLYLGGIRNIEPPDPFLGGYLRVQTFVMNPTRYINGKLPSLSGNSQWIFSPNDKLVVADFDNDGKDDLFVHNAVDWKDKWFCLLKSLGTNFVPVAYYKNQLPGYGTMRENDQLYAADVDGDGRKDLIIFNGRDWNIPYLGILRSTGNGLAFLRRYDQFLPGFEMARFDTAQVADFNGDGKEDLLVQNRNNWNQAYLGLFTSTGTNLAKLEVHYGAINKPNFTFTMRSLDTWRVLDFNGDGASDLALFNGAQWNTEYLVLFASTIRNLNPVRVYADKIPGWDMKPVDYLYVANFDSDNDDDLVFLNTFNWSSVYLGRLKSDGVDALSGSWQKGSIGNWDFDVLDNVRPVELHSFGGKEDLLIFGTGRLGLLWSLGESYSLSAYYPKWLHNHRYHRNNYW